MACNLPLHAQFVDDFSDSDFAQNPAWQGDVSNFSIDNFRLRLQAPAAAGSSYMSTASEAINNAQWLFTMNLVFNPSSSNFARIYLASNQQDMSGPLDGYFVLVGDTPDEISLYRQAGIVTTKIIDGPDGLVNLSGVNAVVKVIRDAIGNWQLFADVNNTGIFSLMGTTTDNTFDSSNYFGIQCNYTSTRSDKFYFDDFVVVGDPYVDSAPPEITQVDVVSNQMLIIHFNEALDQSSSNDPSNYSATNNLVSSATLRSDNLSVELIFSTPFENGIDQIIQVSNIMDLAGNRLINESKSFLYFNPVPAQFKDVIINEVLADPSPQVGLPDAEYVELVNRSPNPFDLAGWTFSDGNSTATLPSKIMLPNEYLIITSSSNSSKFGITSPVMGVSNFPTLNNSTDTLLLKDPVGVTIDSINYDLSWYQSVDKQEGGWALELIDPGNICEDKENWVTAENETGGTPGTINSVFANNPDIAGPHLISVTIVNSNKLLLSFNERLEKPIPLNISFSISPETIVSNYYFENKSLRSLILELSASLSTKQLYNITINNLYDCSGNLINEDFNSIDFAVPEVAIEGDVIINEILFNPRPGGVDFVELYNKSEKYINLKNWSIGNFEEGMVQNSKMVSSSELIMSPKAYLAFTSNAMILKDQYPLGDEKQFIQTNLPSFPDDEGSVAVANENNLLIDYFNYSDQWHSQLIKDSEGVSLERISLTESTLEKSNWISASSTSGFATPGIINSNFRPEKTAVVGEVKIEPSVFSPIDLATHFSQINFRFDQTGFVANIKILDHQGRLIKTIASNETISFEGFFRWDGDQDDGSQARAGYYIVWFEVFDASGFQKTFRERVIIAHR